MAFQLNKLSVFQPCALKIKIWDS